MKKKVMKKDAPAMQSGLIALEGRLFSKIKNVEEDVAEIKAVLDVVVGDVDTLKQDMGGIKNVVVTILEIVQTIDVRLKESSTHGTMLQNHEKRITDTEVQIRMIRR